MAIEAEEYRQAGVAVARAFGESGDLGYAVGGS